MPWHGRRYGPGGHLAFWNATHVFPDGGDRFFRQIQDAKLRLVDVEPGLIEDAMRPGHQLVARVRLTDAKGNPVCARVRPAAIAWSAGPG